MITAEHIKNRKQVLDFIEAYPQFHNQSGYFCGTVACIAGTTIMFDRLSSVENLVSTFKSSEAIEDNFLPEDSGFFWELDTAVALLGLTEEEATNLFYDWDEASAVERLRVLAQQEPDE